MTNATVPDERRRRLAESLQILHGLMTVAALKEGRKLGPRARRGKPTLDFSTVL